MRGVRGAREREREREILEETKEAADYRALYKLSASSQGFTTGNWVFLFLIYFFDVIPT